MVQGAEKGPVPSVAIDGARIRSVRESKKLTQLYVASVVGVTTDTISRWENNRYPSIKRDNAEKLAAALEVELSEILRQDEAPEASPEAAAEPTRSRKMMLWMGGSLILALVVGVVFSLARRPAGPPTAVRWVPKFAAPGDIVPVQIKVTRPPNDTSGFILKERLPDGMRLVSSLPPDSATESARSDIKWLIPDGKSSVVVSYTMKVPSPALSNEGKFSGEVVLRKGNKNRTETIGGEDTIRIGGYHWADSNGDLRIDDDEIMPAYYIYEEMKGLGLDWKIIEAIWSGKGYRWEPGKGFQVVN